MPNTQVSGLQPRLGGGTLDLRPNAGCLLGAPVQPVTLRSHNPRSLITGVCTVSAYPEVAPMVAAQLWDFRPTVSPLIRVHPAPTPHQAGGALALTTLTRLSNRGHFSYTSGTNPAWGVSVTHPMLLQLSFLTAPSALSSFFSRLTALSAASTHARFDLYTSMPEDIRSIRRLRSSKAVCLPCDTPLHIVCGSKDVIHSWAIPGLGIKIDCIPGFSSHRRLLLRWRGVFWGQCMEVCGRYHHWMPILVHVTHKDLFVS